MSATKDPSSPSGGSAKAGSGSEVSTKDKRTLNGDDINYSNLEQNILSRNIDKTYDFYVANRDLFVYRTFRQVQGASSSTIINKLKGTPDFTSFQHMKTSTLSLMQPKIRLYKVSHVEEVEEPVGSGKRQVVQLPLPCYKEFKFSDNFGYELASSTQDYLAYESTKPSFRNVGLQSFTMHNKGGKYMGLEKNVWCQLKISFKSLKDLEAQPPGEPSPLKGGLRYTDLIIFPPTKINSKTDGFNSKHYQIKALIGWTAPSEQQLLGLNLSRKEIEDIKNLEKFNTMLSLRVQNYDISIKDNGQVIVTIDYKSFIDTTIESQSATIFKDSLQVTKAGELESRCVSDNSLTKVARLKAMLISLVEQLNEDSCVNDPKCEAKDKIINLLNKDTFFAKCYKEAKGPGLDSRYDTDISEAHGAKPTVESAPGRVADREQVLTWIKNMKNAEVVLGVMKKKIGAFKKVIYQSFIDELIEGQSPAAGGFGTRLFCFKAKRPEIESAMGILPEPSEDSDRSESHGGEATIEKDAGMAKSTEQEMISSISSAIGKDEASKSVVVGRCKDIEEKVVSIKEDNAQKLTEATAVKEESESKDSEKEEDAGKDINRKSTLSSDVQSHTFYYLYLGDIIELACKNAGFKFLAYEGELATAPSIYDKSCYVKTENNNGDIDYALTGLRILTGPVEYLDSSRKIRTINLAQFPVSFNYFRAWFLNKIVRRRAAEMNLNIFLKLLISDLVLPAMGATIGTSIKPKNTRPTLLTLTLPGQQKPGQKVNICGRAVQPFDELLPAIPVIDVNGPRFSFNYHRKVSEITESETLMKTSFDYLLLQFSTIKDVTERTGNPLEDVRDGIMHFSVGSDMGIVKSMNFKKTNQQFRAEQLHFQATEKGLDQIQQLKFPYNTDVKLIGAPFFTPGMRYYINPSLLGLGPIERANSLAAQMNLGGYHIIKDVKMTISQRGFETILTGYQEGHGRRGIK